MNDDNNDLLTELEKHVRVKPKSFNLVVMLFVVYILALLMVSILRFRYFSGIETLIYAGLVILPIVGLLYFSRGKRFGWIISFFYYQLLSLMSALAFVGILTTTDSDHLFNSASNIFIFPVACLDFNCIFFVFERYKGIF